MERDCHSQHTCEYSTSERSFLKKYPFLSLSSSHSNSLRYLSRPILFRPFAEMFVISLILPTSCEVLNIFSHIEGVRIFASIIVFSRSSELARYQSTLSMTEIIGFSLVFMAFFTNFRLCSICLIQPDWYSSIFWRNLHMLNSLFRLFLCFFDQLHIVLTSLVMILLMFNDLVSVARSLDRLLLGEVRQLGEKCLITSSLVKKSRLFLMMEALVG